MQEKQIFNINFPHSDGSSRSISLGTGDILFALGANGTGKSSLMHKFFQDNPGRSRRITAHRQTWFASNTLDMTAANKRNVEQHMTNSDRGSEARWKDDYSAQRSSITIFELIDAENVRARKLTYEFDRGDIEAATVVSRTEAPVKIINELLKQSNLPIEIGIERNEEITARKNGGAPYSIAQLSDGERNALLIAASVLTASPGSLILVDEPERHLHRSIISPLLNLLFAKRPDCGFVISTHDVTLPLDDPKAQILLVRSCVYQGITVTSWDADLMPAGSEIDDDVKIDVLGARKKIIFVEGRRQSMDLPLYSMIFPGISIIPKNSCRDVKHFVTSIRESAPLHWLSAWGIVDNDRRPTENLDQLRRKGVYALEHHSVESIYYHPDMIRRMAVRHAELTGADPSQMVKDAFEKAMAALSTHKERLCIRVSENKVREAVFQNLPTFRSISDRTPIHIEIDVDSIVREEVTAFEQALQEADIQTLVRRYPVRETPALNDMVDMLGFKDRERYESSVRKLLSDDETALAFVKSLFGDLPADVETLSGTTAINLA